MRAHGPLSVVQHGAKQMIAQWLVTVSVLVICVSFFVESLDFPNLAADPGGPALLPRWLCAITGAAALIMLGQLTMKTAWWDLPGRVGSWLRETIRLAGSDDSEGAIRRRLLIVFVATLAYPLVMSEVGFAASTFVLGAGLLLLFGTSVWRSVATSATVTSVIYVFFAHVMGSYVPQGALIERLH